jgi:AMP deaminase
MSRIGGTLFTEGGPPDPISYLRRVSQDPDSDDVRRSDSADDSSIGEEPSNHLRKKQDPPARERPAAGQPWPHRDALSFTRSLIFYGAGAITHEHERACVSIQEARKMRQKYCGGCSTKSDTEALKDPNLVFQFGKEGVVELYHETDHEKENNLCQVPNIEEFSKDYHRLVELVNEGSMRSFCFQRLQLLSSAFRMHVTMNGSAEAKEQSSLLGTDFYRTFKIDNHIHAAAAMSAKQFVSFVTDKLETESDTVVSKDGQTLRQVFEDAGIDKDHLTIDAFNVLADYSVYQRFDNFNANFSPFRMADMRRIFLKTSNHMGGRYFAELMKIVLNRLETSKGHASAAEMRLSIYGMERHEWEDLADWMFKDWGGDFPGPVISTNNRWLIQIPRLWRIYSTKPGLDNPSFLEMLENIFVPMFEATLYPDKHPKIAETLKHIVGIDSVDDEGSAEVSHNNLA